MDEKISLDAQKYEYLKSRGLSFNEGLNKFLYNCELCNKPLPSSLRISKRGLAWEIKIHDGEFHHDGEGCFHLYCHTCHIRLHDWGIIQRWLKKINKETKDLPDCTKLATVIKGF